MSKLYKLKNYKFILVIYVLILNTLGVFLVGSASPGDQKKQIIGMVSGIVIMVILSLIDYSFILRFSWIIYLLAVGLLALVLVAGDSSKGAQRWFEIGGIRFQPSELVKILLILFFAYYFMKYEEKINTVRVIVSSFVLLAIPLFLIYKQPNLSTMIVITLVFCALLFMAGLNYKLVVGVLIVCIPVGLIGMTLIIQDKIHSSTLISWGVSWHGFIRTIIRILPTSSRIRSWRSVPDYYGEKDLTIRIRLRSKTETLFWNLKMTLFSRLQVKNLDLWAVQ